MKKLFILFFVFVSAISSAQEIENDTIYKFSEVDVKPEFPGGIEQFYKFVGRNYNMPKADNINGKVLVEFVIEKNGAITDIDILQDVGHGSGEEVIRMLKKSPLWKPGEKNGVPVRTLFGFPISIRTQ